MRKIIKTTLCALPLLFAAACDTKEDSYYAGAEPTDILSADVAEIHLNADGTPMEVGVTAICAWDASLSGNENVFRIDASTDRGDGTVTVSAEPNYGSGVKSSTLILTARNFDKKVSVNIMQASLTFSMEEKEYPAAKEEGGGVDLSFESTTGWELSVRANSSDPEDVGSLDWLDFMPGYSGDGDYYETVVTATWKPNYTAEEREITLVLVPANDKLLQYIDPVPQPFTLRQEAGTLPQNVAGDTISMGMYDGVCRVAYESRSPIRECGVTLIDSQTGQTVTALASEPQGGFPMSGAAEVSVSGLEHSRRYELVPFVENMVGRSEGNGVSFTTKSDPERTEYVGASVDDVIITPSQRSVEVELRAIGDVPLRHSVMTIIDADGKEVAQVEGDIMPVEPLGDGLSQMRCIYRSDDILTPKTVYRIVIEYVCEDVAAGVVVNPGGSVEREFETLSRTPNEDDNDTPDIEP